MVYSRIYTHRNFANRAARGQKLPSYIPVKGIVFDQVLVRPCHVDQLDELEEAAINLYKPRYNTSLKNGLKIKAPISLTIAGVALTLNEERASAPGPKFVRRI